jgi:hypothetical protein
MRATLDNLPAIAAGLPDRDTAENTVRLLTEHALQSIVTAFQIIRSAGRRVPLNHDLGHVD